MDQVCEAMQGQVAQWRIILYGSRDTPQPTNNIPIPETSESSRGQERCVTTCYVITVTIGATAARPT
jgi:hypothetical protein